MATEAFAYCWTDKTKNLLYVGTHKGSPDDTYICSSKAMLEEYKKRPDDFSREILAFGTYAEMIKFEAAILKSINAAQDPGFYNMHNGDGNFFNKGHAEATRQKLKIARNKRTDKPRLGKPLSEDGKVKASESAKRRSLTEEGKQHLSNAGKKSAEKRKNDPEYKQHLSKKSADMWEKRRNGLLSWPKNMKGRT
jgi:hypothetical protein